ncbi:NAD(P)-binding protein [Pluteus cervinus]|uniref:NAD(P)-binding protein n=1 Tax=Pluteus cervinus TaxID=181527 RepID=A0ACD3ARW8_9AGAR|nr:NAD(P)-binding protein [Pluteus cervinus]
MGGVMSGLSEAFPPKPEFTAQDVPDLNGKVMVVTGGNTGIGKETVKALLQRNARVYLAGRSQEKCEAAISDLKRQTGNEAIFLELDLSDLKSVKAAATEFQRKETHLHSLFNNAGVMGPPVGELTAQGYDLQFGTNVLGHFYFTKLLLPTLLKTAQAEPVFKARVVNTSSGGHLMGSLDFNTFRTSPAREKLGSFGLYNQSKYGNVVFAKELTRRYGDKGLVSTSLNPGSIKSDLQRHMPKWLLFFLASPFIPGQDFFFYEPWYGALTQLWAGTSPEGAGFGGRYLIPWARMGKALESTTDPALGKQLWAWLEEQTEQFEMRSIGRT